MYPYEKIFYNIFSPCDLFSILLIVSFAEQKFNFFFFSFLAALWHVEFLDQGSNLSSSFDLCCSCSNARSFKLLCQTGDQSCGLVLQRCRRPSCGIAETPQILNFNEIHHISFPSWVVLLGLYARPYNQTQDNVVFHIF